MAGKKKGADDELAEVSFENALEELESLVEKMETGELSLEDSLAAFERGVKLAHLFYRRAVTEHIHIIQGDRFPSGNSALSPPPPPRKPHFPTAQSPPDVCRTRMPRAHTPTTPPQAMGGG